MKLVIAIVRDDYSEILQDELADAGHRYTKLASTGGFLRKGNTTLLVGIDDDQVG
ncbi:MAG TPA: cyclic-di-AMP receptor, partial [Bacillota bacterium]|nr:cyclic-di-AMP receptor [Bacillota bacterium]